MNEQQQAAWNRLREIVKGGGFNQGSHRLLTKEGSYEEYCFGGLMCLASKLSRFVEVWGFYEYFGNRGGVPKEVVDLFGINIEKVLIPQHIQDKYFDEPCPMNNIYSLNDIYRLTFTELLECLEHTLEQNKRAKGFYQEQL
jgi:hypothetical protein